MIVASTTLLSWLRLTERFFETLSKVQPVLRHNSFLHQVSDDPGRPPLTVFLDRGLARGGRWNFLVGPVAHPCGLLGGGPGNDVRVFEGVGGQRVDVGGMSIAHGKGVAFHLVDRASLTLISKVERPVVRLARSLILPDKHKLQERKLCGRRGRHPNPFSRVHWSCPLLSSKYGEFPVPDSLDSALRHLEYRKASVFAICSHGQRGGVPYCFGFCLWIEQLPRLVFSDLF